MKISISKVLTVTIRSVAHAPSSDNKVMRNASNSKCEPFLKRQHP